MTTASKANHTQDVKKEEATQPEAKKPKKPSRIENVSRMQARETTIKRKSAAEIKREKQMVMALNVGIILLCILTLLIPIFGMKYMIALLIILGVGLASYFLIHATKQLHLTFAVPKEEGVGKPSEAEPQSKN